MLRGYWFFNNIVRCVLCRGIGRPEQDQVCALFEPGVARTQGGDLCAGDHGHGIEGEAVERFVRGQLRFAQMPFDPTTVAFSDFVFGQGCNQAGAGPALLVGAGGKVCPYQLDCGQTQLIENEADALGIDGGVVGGDAFVLRSWSRNAPN